MRTLRYCTPEWLEASAKYYKSTPEYQQKFKNISAKLCFRIRAKPDWSIDEDIIFEIFIDQGKLLQLAFLDEQEAQEQADYLMAATPDEWKKILRKESKFVTEFLLGKVALEKGSKAGVLQIAPHSSTLVEVLTSVDLQFPDEMTGEELQAYRNYIIEFRADLGV